MELNENTLNVLKNFSAINPNLIVREGGVLKTMSESKTVVAEANLDQMFPKQFGIYDVGEFLSVLNLVDGPRLRFEDNYVVIGDRTGRASIKYWYCAPEMLTTPQKDITMPECEITFTLDVDTLSKIKKASSVLGHGQVSIHRQDGVTRMTVLDEEDKTSNSFSIDVDCEFQEEDFNFVWSIENWKMIPGDYTVSVSSKMISHFVNKENGIQYWVALKL